jgi:hypothetical protein
MALTQTERDRIVALRLDGRSIRDVVAETGHASQTVSNVWHLYLAEVAQDRRPDLDLRREELLQRIERNAADARAGVVVAQDTGDHGATARYLAAELAALNRLADLEGLAADRVRASGGAGTAANPLPWKAPEEVLGHRVAAVERRRLEDKALNTMLYADDLTTLAYSGLPEVAELAPVAVANLATVEP